MTITVGDAATRNEKEVKRRYPVTPGLIAGTTKTEGRTINLVRENNMKKKEIELPEALPYILKSYVLSYQLNNDTDVYITRAVKKKHQTIKVPLSEVLNNSIDNGITVEVPNYDILFDYYGKK